MVFKRQRDGSLNLAARHGRFQIGIALLLAIGVLSPGRSLAFPVASDHCSSDQIWAAIHATGTFPKLRGCDPQAVKNALSDSNYRLQVESRHSSNSIAPGLITRQRVQSTTVYVTVSTGPDEPGAGQNQPKLGGLIGQIIVGALEHPPQSPPQPAPPPVVAVEPLPPQPPPAPPAVAEQPAPAPAQPVKVAQVVQPVDTPAPAAQHPAPQPKPKPQAPKPAAPKTATAQQTSTTAKTAAAAPGSPAEPHRKVCPDGTVIPAGTACPVPTPQFSIEGNTRITEGEDLELQIRREGNDHKAHRLVLSYTDPSLLGFTPTTLDYGADLPNVITQRLPTRVNPKHDGEHDLAITLMSAEGARVGSPDSILVAIADLKTPSWWDKLKMFLASFPAWAVAFAGAAVAGTAGLGIARFILPHATCSIGSGRATLGPIPLRSSWPALHVDTVIGGASFSIPHPLPTGVKTHAEPSPA